MEENLALLTLDRKTEYKVILVLFVGIIDE